MDIHELTADIPCYTIKAASFPDKVLEAHQALHRLYPWSAGRRYFGLSRPEGGGGITYYAAAEILPGEESAEQTGNAVIQKGHYLVKEIPAFKKNLSLIGETFRLMLQDNRIDPQGYCVEWYTGMEDLQCMVRLSGL